MQNLTSSPTSLALQHDARVIHLPITEKALTWGTYLKYRFLGTVSKDSDSAGLRMGQESTPLFWSFLNHTFQNPGVVDSLKCKISLNTG